MRKEVHMMKTVLQFIFIVFLSTVIIAQLICVTEANPIINIYRDISPPDGTQAPVITIHSPKNGSYNPNNITLTFNVAIPQINDDKSLDTVTTIYYESNWQTSEITVAEGSIGSFSINLSEVRGGNPSVTIYAVGEGYIETGEEYREENDVIYSYHYYDRFEMIGYSTVSFIKDLIFPKITILSPQNVTYNSSDVKLTCLFTEDISKASYCLDGNKNVTFVGDIILDNLPAGEHELVIYVQDLAGNIGVSEKTYFSITEPFPTTLAVTSIAVIAVIGMGILVYFKKYKK